MELKTIAGFLLALGGSSWASADVIRSQYKENLCLAINDEEDSGWRIDRNVEAMACDGDNHQQFTLVSIPLESGETVFRVEALGQCVAIDAEATESWTKDSNALLMPCNDSARQQFEQVPQGAGWFSLRSRLDGRCLDIDLNNGNGWRTERNVHLWPCHGEPNQLWQVSLQPSDSPDQVP
jgi:hypothetical protein